MVGQSLIKIVLQAFIFIKPTTKFEATQKSQTPKTAAWSGRIYKIHISKKYLDIFPQTLSYG